MKQNPWVEVRNTSCAYTCLALQAAGIGKISTAAFWLNPCEVDIRQCKRSQSEKSVKVANWSHVYRVNVLSECCSEELKVKNLFTDGL